MASDKANSKLYLLHVQNTCTSYKVLYCLQRISVAIKMGNTNSSWNFWPTGRSFLALPKIFIHSLTSLMCFHCIYIVQCLSIYVKTYKLVLRYEILPCSLWFIPFLFFFLSGLTIFCLTSIISCF